MSIDANINNATEAPKVPLFPVAATETTVGVKVRALAKGFHLGLREAGEVFVVPAGMKSKWFVPVEKPAAAKATGTVLSDADLA